MDEAKEIHTHTVITEKKLKIKLASGSEVNLRLHMAAICGSMESVFDAAEDALKEMLQDIGKPVKNGGG